ncbi:type-2 ice-structuring protein-like isoform X1 [Labrus bergylta]|uniref:type-2 ice-structuring protein-like isoform X1 n=1 Tax=Labrus bergylta TaxID=56723 RepID=UPI00331442AE
MKLLALCALLCAMVALSSAEAAAEPEPENAKSEEVDVDKRTCWCWSRPSWTKIGCRYFFYIRKPLTWHQAERNCRRLGGHLASVHSRRQYLKIRALIKKSSRGSPATWIGGTDRCREGHWRWSDGSRLNYKNWCCGEPNNAGNQDCLQMNFSRRKCWDDAQCWLKRPSVCVRNRRW